MTRSPNFGVSPRSWRRPQLPPTFASLLEEDMISPIRKRSHKRCTPRRGWKCLGDLYPGMHLLLEKSSWCWMAASLNTTPYCVFIWVSACPEIFISPHLLASGCWAILLLSWLRNPTSRPKAKWLEANKGKSRCALVRSLKVCPFLLINQPRRKHTSI